MTEGTTLSTTATTSDSASASRRLGSSLLGLALLPVGAFVALWALLAFDDAQVPAGQGWVAGHYYDKTAEQVLESLIGTAALAAVSAFLLTFAFSLWRLAATKRPLSRRILLLVPTVAAVATLCAALASTKDFCAPQGCTAASGELH